MLYRVEIRSGVRRSNCATQGVGQAEVREHEPELAGSVVEFDRWLAVDNEVAASGRGRRLPPWAVPSTAVKQIAVEHTMVAVEFRVEANVPELYEPRRAGLRRRGAEADVESRQELVVLLYVSGQAMEFRYFRFS